MKKSLKHASAAGASARTPLQSQVSSPRPQDEPVWELPAIRGVQAHREYFAVMIHLRLLGAFFAPVDGSLPPELRAQRTLNKARVPKISAYIRSNPDDYTFSALTGAIDGEPVFEPASENSRMGMLRIPRRAAIAILDGQHRKAAIEAAVKDDAAKKNGGTLGDETIAVILFADRGLTKAQQRFADLNRFAVRPNGSIGLLYDHRDETASLAKAVVAEVPLFRTFTEAEKTSVAGGASKLFALSAVHAATKALLASTSYKPTEAKKVAVTFWTEVSNAMPAWAEVAKGTVKAKDLREKYVHAHAVALEALGRVGNALLRDHPDTWTNDVKRLAELDWSRSAPVWTGRAIVNGRVAKNAASVVLTANAIKTHLGLELGIEDRRLESSLETDA